MQIPVYKKDFSEKKFSNIARKLKESWPGKIKLSQAQAILSNCLGYKNLHSVTSQANSPSNILEASSFSHELISSQSRKCLAEEFGLSNDDIDAILNQTFFDLTCTNDQFAKSMIIDLVCPYYFDNIKKYFISGISRPVVVGSEYQPTGIYSVLEIIEATGVSRNIVSHAQTLMDISKLSDGSRFTDLVRDFSKHCLRHAVSTTVFNIEAKTLLEKNTGVKIDDLIFYLGTIRYELESSLTPLLHQLNEINVEFFYLKRRLENGFYNSYRTEMPESLKPRKIKNGFYHMSIGRDSYSYDSLPWTLHNFSATIYDQSNTLAAYVNGSVYVSKCSYSVDAEDLVYAADHVDDLDVSMAGQAMEQIIQDFGDDDDYTYVFDNHVIIFIQTWERRFDAPAGLGGKLLEKTIKEICRKYKMPAILICRANSPKILSDDKNAPAFKEIIGRAQQRVIDSYEKVFNHLDDTSDCVEYVYYTDKLFNKTDVQRTIGSFYGNLFKGL